MLRKAVFECSDCCCQASQLVSLNLITQWSIMTLLRNGSLFSLKLIGLHSRLHKEVVFLLHFSPTRHPRSWSLLRSSTQGKHLCPVSRDFPVLSSTSDLHCTLSCTLNACGWSTLLGRYGQGRVLEPITIVQFWLQAIVWVLSYLC